MNCLAVCIQPPRIDEFLPLARPFIERATARCGDWTADEIVQGLREGRMLLWFALCDGEAAGAAVTELVTTRSTGRMCNIILCGGTSLRRWAHLKDAIEAYARAQGCTRVRLSGRRGWARVFRDYQQPYVTLEKMM